MKRKKRVFFCLSCIFKVGMAIVARFASIWPSLTLMGRILPGPIKNRIGFGLKKSRSGSGSGLGFFFFLTPKRVQVGVRVFLKPDPVTS